MAVSREEVEDDDQDEMDALIYAAHEVTFEAAMLAHRIAYGVADLDEGRKFLADTDTSANVYIDLSWLEQICSIVEAGLYQPPAHGFN